MSFDARIAKVEAEKQEILGSLKSWMEKMEAASQSQAPAQGAAPGGGLPWGSIIERGMKEFGLSGSGSSPLENQLTQEMMRGYVLWIRNGIKQMNRAFGLPDHMTVG